MVSLDRIRGLAYGDHSMVRVYRVSKGQEVGEVVDTIKAVEAFARDNGPGRYHVDKIRSDALPSGHTARRWGVVTTMRDSTVNVDRDPWPE
jgi:hypothetical protein